MIDAYSLPIETIFEQRNGQDYSTKTSYLYTSNLQEAKDYPTQTIDIGGNDSLAETLRERTFTYDEQGRLKTATDLGNDTYSYNYGDDGLALIESPLSQTTTGLQKEMLGYGYDPIITT